MIRGTGEFSWVRVPASKLVPPLRSPEPVHPLHSVSFTNQNDEDEDGGELLLCEKMVDLHSDKVSWRPIPIVIPRENEVVLL